MIETNAQRLTRAWDAAHPRAPCVRHQPLAQSSAEGSSTTYHGSGPRMNGGVTAYGFVGLSGLYGLP